MAACARPWSKTHPDSRRAWPASIEAFGHARVTRCAGKAHGQQGMASVYLRRSSTPLRRTRFL